MSLLFIDFVKENRNRWRRCYQPCIWNSSFLTHCQDFARRSQRLEMPEQMKNENQYRNIDQLIDWTEHSLWGEKSVITTDKNAYNTNILKGSQIEVRDDWSFSLLHRWATCCPLLKTEWHCCSSQTVLVSLMSIWLNGRLSFFLYMSVSVTSVNFRKFWPLRRYMDFFYLFKIEGDIS